MADYLTKKGKTMDTIKAQSTDTALKEKFQTKHVTAIATAHALHDSFTAFLPPLLPAFIEKFALARAEAGLLTVFLQLPSLLQPLFGRLADHVSLRYIVIIAPAVTAIAMSLIGVAPSYAVIAFLLVIAGISSASLHAVAPAITGKNSGKHLGRGMSFWMVGGELGRTLGPLLIVSVVSHYTLKATPALILIGITASVILYTQLKHVPDQLTKKSNPVHWKQSLIKMAPVMLPIIGIVVSRGFLQSVLTTYLPTFLTENGASFWLAGAALTILEMAGVVGALFGGSISDRLGRRRVLFTSMTVSPILTYFFITGSEALRIPLLIVIGLFMMSINPVIMAIVQESFPEDRAFANGVYMAINFVIRSLIVVLVGALGDRFGINRAFVFSSLVALVGLPFVLRLPGRKIA
jgi:FSR family fosmidomycin resistance protein-like MFS transporter